LRWIIYGAVLIVSLVFIMIFAVVFNEVYFSSTGLKEILDKTAQETMGNTSEDYQTLHTQGSDMTWMYGLIFVVIAACCFILFLVYSFYKSDKGGSYE
jgi:hypothetical protein